MGGAPGGTVGGAPAPAGAQMVIGSRPLSSALFPTLKLVGKTGRKELKHFGKPLKLERREFSSVTSMGRLTTQIQLPACTCVRPRPLLRLTAQLRIHI